MDQAGCLENTQTLPEPSNGFLDTQPDLLHAKDLETL